MWVVKKWHIWQFSRKWQESIKGFAKPQMRWQRGKSWQTAIIRKWQILGEKGKFRQRWRVCQNVIEASAKYSNKITKVASWQMTILRKLQIWQEFIGLAKIKTRWQKRHVDNCGFYENDKFCEIGEFGFINGLAKILNETTKEAFLVCNHETRRQCWGSIQYNFSRIINMKIEFGSQMLLFLTTNMAAVTSSADQQYWQLAISRNWQIEKIGDWARIYQRFGKNSNEVTKRGNLTNGDYKKVANFGKNGEFKSLAK